MRLSIVEYCEDKVYRTNEEPLREEKFEVPQKELHTVNVNLFKQ
jgi:hypothetical protein